MDKELRVLIAEDSAVDAELIIREFVKEDLVCTSKLVKSKDDFIKALGEYKPDIILCDYTMPGFNAPEALEIVKISSPETPFIVVSGTIGEDIAVETMKSGATDYVLKDRILRLVPAVKRALKESEEHAERKETEKEAEILKQRIEFILGATKTGLDIIDSDFNMVYIDPEWQKIYGDYKGRKCYEYFMGRDTMCPACGITKAIQTKKTVVTEEVLPRESNRPVQVTTMPFQNEKGEWLVAEVNTDITERKQAEEKLRGSEERLRMALIVADIGTWRWDPRSNSDTRGASFNRILGLKPEESTQQVEDFFERVHPDDRPRVKEAIELSVRSRETYIAEFRIIKQDGEIRWLRDQGKGFYNDDKEMVYMTGAVVDVTERKKADEELKKKMLDLESFHKLAVGRELKMEELKKRIKELEKAKS